MDILGAVWHFIEFYIFGREVFGGDDEASRREKTWQTRPAAENPSETIYK